jgi:hypothetical protein
VNWLAWTLFAAAVLLLLAWSLGKIQTQPEPADHPGRQRDWPEPDQMRVRWPAALALGLVVLALIIWLG